MSGIKLQLGELARAAATIGVTEAHLRTIIEVETSGKGFNSQGQVEFLFESHVFYKTVSKDKLPQAIKLGVAYKFWKGPGSYPKTPTARWQQFQTAVSLDETAAIKSASWGLGQIMGSEYAEAGFNSPQEMLVAFSKSEYNQILGMCSLIKSRGLDKALKGFPSMDACERFALRYNGAGYKKNKYHIKLHDAYLRWSKRGDFNTDDGSLRAGDTGDEVKQAQKLLEQKGYSLLVDGKFGRGTRDVVMAWQADNGRPVTGFLSKDDLELLPNSPNKEISAERTSATVSSLKPESTIIQKSSLGKQVLGWGGTVVGGVQAADAVGLLDSTQEAVDRVSQVKSIFDSIKELLADTGLLPALKWVSDHRFVLLLVVVVVGFFIFNQVQKRRLEMHKEGKIG